MNIINIFNKKSRIDKIFCGYTYYCHKFFHRPSKKYLSVVFVLSSYRGGYKIIAFIGFCWYKMINFNCTLYLPFILCSWPGRTWWSRTWSVWRNRQSESWARPRVRGQCVSICLKFGSGLPIVKDSTSFLIHTLYYLLFILFLFNLALNSSQQHMNFP